MVTGLLHYPLYYTIQVTPLLWIRVPSERPLTEHRYYITGGLYDRGHKAMIGIDHVVWRRRVYAFRPIMTYSRIVLIHLHTRVSNGTLQAGKYDCEQNFVFQ